MRFKKRNRRTRDKLDENSSSCLQNRLSQRRDCPPVRRDLRTDARPADNDRAIADIQPDVYQQVLPVSASDGHAQELLLTERHRQQPDGSRLARCRRVHLHQHVVHKHEGPSCGMRRCKQQLYPGRFRKNTISRSQKLRIVSYRKH